MMYRLAEYMPREAANKWGRILGVAQELGVVTYSEAAGLGRFLSQPWLLWPYAVHDSRIARLHAINKVVHDTLRRQVDAAVTEASQATKALRQAIETQKTEEQKANAALRKIEVVQAQLREISG